MIRTLLLPSVSLWECMWQSTLFAVVGLMGSILLRRRPARAHQVLLFAMMAAVMVPVLSGVVRHFNLRMFTHEVPEAVRWLEPVAMEGDALAATSSSVVEPESLESSAGSSPDIGPTGASFAWRPIAGWAWLAATVTLLGRLFFAFAVGVYLARRAQPLSGGPIVEAVGLAKARLRTAKDLQVRVHKVVRSPVIWCWSRQPVLLLPGDLDVFGRKVDWVGVISHELAHWKRRDHVSGLLAELAVCVLPWNPLLWLSKRHLVSLTEQACDDWVVASGQPGEDYAESLLDFKPQKQMSFVPAVVHNSKGVAARVRRIVNDRCGNPRPGTKWTLTLSLIAICIAVSVAFAQARPVTPETPIKQEEKPAQSLYKAAEAGDIEVVKKLLAEGIDVNAMDEESKMTPLCAAAGAGHTEVVTLLLQNGANVELGDSHVTPLYYAIWSDVNATVKALIAGGANVNVLPGPKDYPPLIYAMWQNHADNVRTLLDAGATLDHRDQSGCTPLYWAAFTSGGAFRINRSILDMILAKGRYEDTIHLAACQGQLDRVKALVEAGTDVNHRDEFGCTPLQWAVLADSPAVAEFLIAEGANIASEDTMECTPLTVARGPAMVHLLLSKGANVNAQTTRTGWTRLHNACFAGDKEVAELLLRRGADANAKSRNNMTPLRFAALRGHVELVELLIANGADVNAADNRGRTPLSLARQGKHTGVVEILLKHGAKESLHDVMAGGDIDQIRRLLVKGADVNAKDAKDQTPLHVAVVAGRKDIVELLIANGADIDAKSNTWDTTPLVAAVRAGHEEIAKLLIAQGADVKAKARGDYTALHWAACNRARMRGVIDIVIQLLAKGADIEAKQEHGATPLACATYDGNTESAGFLIERGANVEATLNDGETTPLLRAVSQQYVETARVLLDKGANVHATWRGLSAIDNAMLGDRLSNRKGDPEMVKLLMEKGLQCPSTHLAAFSGDLQKLKNLLNDGAKVDEQDAAGFTPLHCAVCGDHMDVVRFLLSKDAHVNAKTTNGWTPLRFAWTVDMAAFLIAHGADVKIPDERGTTLLHGAVNLNEHKGDKALIELLLKHGADVNARAASTSVGWAGWTPFHVACRNGNPDIVALLLARGADVKAKTDKGETPLAVAQSNEQARIVNLLRGRGVQE